MYRKSFEHCQPADLKLRNELVRKLASEFVVESLCVVLRVSRTAYYRYLRGESYQPTPDQQKHRQLVEDVFCVHKRRYGSRRITAELNEQGHVIGRHQVRTLMKVAGLQAIQPHRRPG